MLNKEVYVEFNASGDAFCLITDRGDAFVKGNFMSRSEAIDWAVKNGFKVNVYEDGKLLKQIDQNCY